ncbi:hypothetical protein A2U01_0008661, partial [Trifolium medium]|nr:hypothetical protein [Trifolium medium]
MRHSSLSSIDLPRVSFDSSDCNSSMASSASFTSSTAATSAVSPVQDFSYPYFIHSNEFLDQD